LLAGLTNETDERYWVHLSERLPAGIFESSFWLMVLNY